MLIAQLSIVKVLAWNDCNIMRESGYNPGFTYFLHSIPKEAS